MSEENKSPENQPDGLNPEAEAVNEAAAAAEESAVDPVEALMAENADLKDRALRTMAEMENLRRRTEKEVKDARQYAVSGFARDMLTVSDNLSRALEALPEDDRKNADAGVASLIEGVEMIERDLLNQLEKNGVRKLEPEGQKFDPNFHQAMFEVPNTEVPNNTVVQVVQAGYVIGERVLRPAMVGVSKGGPKEAPKADAGAEPGETVDKSA
ncbi:MULTISPECIES: nucleotide exchange factor GrpE [Stappiaceae]|uniref:nucleotide exchange factor GrpE n=1 Tax=Stappiaceae TaxID=2821832 RepID=UPI001ADA7236|nr:MULTISPECIES: nucleotide exchange factor GrpE [Stappiaceae]MBO9420268.1 nucleotide exchange factor GrpE [Labrenzia sp. R4_2]MBO9423358.1 nucleotide exchange factor GrpE [Labrenzia sp. R4_1]